MNGDISCSWLRRLHIVKMLILSKLIHRFQTIPLKIPAGYFINIDNLIPKYICKCKEPRIDKTNLKKKNKFGDFTTPDLKTSVINTVWYWCKDRPIDQWNWMENTEISSYVYGQLVFDKDAVAIQWKKRILFSANGAWTHAIKMNLHPYFSPYVKKNNSTWVIGLNVGVKTKHFYKKA